MDHSCRRTKISLIQLAMEQLDDRQYNLIFLCPTKIELQCGRREDTLSLFHVNLQPLEGRIPVQNPIKLQLDSTI